MPPPIDASPQAADRLADFGRRVEPSFRQPLDRLADVAARAPARGLLDESVLPGRIPDALEEPLNLDRVGARLGAALGRASPARGLLAAAHRSGELCLVHLRAPLDPEPTRLPVELGLGGAVGA